MANPAQYVKDNTNMTMVVSTVIGMLVFGGIAWVAVKSGIKPLADAAKAVK